MERILGEKTVSRSGKEYSAMLFPDDITGNRFINSVIKFSAEINGLEDRIYGDFEYFNPSPTDPRNGSIKTFENLSDILGGKKHFFKNGSCILDLGGGLGKATYDFSKNRNIDVFDLDKILKRRLPYNQKRGNYIAGDWKNLPFADNTFTGILSCEAYPRWNFPSENDEQIIGEVTRVSKEGAILRATLRRTPPFFEGAKEIENEEKKLVVNHLNDFGWEVYVRTGLVIARLQEKQTVMTHQPGNTGVISSHL